LADYAARIARLDAAAVDYLLRALDRLGWAWQAGRRFSGSEMAVQLGLDGRYRRWLERGLDMLADAGIVRAEAGGWEVIQAPVRPTPPPPDPEIAAEAALLARCGEALAEVLRGERDPLQLLFPAGDISDLTRFYQDSPGPRAMNGLVRQALRALLDDLPPERRLRLLEIGGGTGGTTAQLLPHLPAGRIDYVFTDVSSLFTARAQEKFRDYPFVSYRLLDIEQAPETQGFAGGTFDVVVAANVLHATRNLEETLAHAGRLLAPGGLLLLLEGTARRPWVDLTFGLTDGWWRFADAALRPDYPLLDAGRWVELLRAQGFDQIADLSPDPHQQALLAARRAAAARWLVLADAGGLGEELATLIGNAGDICLRTLEECRDAPLHGVVYCRGLDAPPAEALTGDALRAAQQHACGGLLELVQALDRRDGPPPALFVVTRGAQCIAETANPGLAQSPLWGLGRVIAAERPQWRTACIDLDSGSDAARLLLDEIRSPAGEDQIAFRRGVRHVARLARCRPQPARKPLCRADGTYLIAGGLGDLGLLAAHWLARRHGARHLVLAGRRGATAEAADRLEAIRATGAEVMVAQADVADARQLARLLAGIDKSRPPLRGVIHAAGVLDDAALASMTWERFAGVLAPKVLGAWNLHTLTAGCPLDFFVLFSSAAALLGSPGQANHAAANGFLDALAAYRQSQGLPGLSIAWGAWSEIGEAQRRRAGGRMARRGLGVIAPDQGLALLEELMAQPLAHVAAVAVDWPQFFAAQAPAAPFLAAFRPESAAPAALPQQWATLPADQRRERLTAHVQSRVARVLGLPESRPVDPRQGFFDLGMDSLTSVELKNRLQADLDRPLPATLAFKYSTVEKLVEYLAGELFGPDEPARPAALQDVEQLSEAALEALIDEEFRALAEGSDR
nr:SDR family NAD(P)-dependent oxidoreductase [Pseudomonadota bacterium]